MKKISYETERKLYQALGIMQSMSRIEPDGSANADRYGDTIVSMADAAEGAAALLKEAAAIITEAIHS